MEYGMGTPEKEGCCMGEKKDVLLEKKGMFTNG